MVRRTRDAEADLNLPPGFRFHPTDEELVVHYLCRKASQQFLPVPIIAEVDLYKFDPWQLPEKALFGQREWYFFTPRDRKYPNGSRPNRAAGSGYWKATGADKPVNPAGSSKPVGIKKALVFYAGKAPRGAKTNWIMHEYRLADTNNRSSSKKGSLRLDDWVLCRLYNKKNNWEDEQHQQTVDIASFGETTDSFEAVDEAVSESHRSPESDVDNDTFGEVHGQGHFQPPSFPQTMGLNSGMFLETAERVVIKEDNDWFMDLKLEDLHNSFATIPTPVTASMDMGSYQDFYFSGFGSSMPRPASQPGLPPF